MNRAIPHCKPNGKMLYFRRGDIDAWLADSRVAPAEEVEQRALEYCDKKTLLTSHKKGGKR